MYFCIAWTEETSPHIRQPMLSIIYWLLQTTKVREWKKAAQLRNDESEYKKNHDKYAESNGNYTDGFYCELHTVYKHIKIGRESNAFILINTLSHTHTQVCVCTLWLFIAYARRDIAVYILHIYITKCLCTQVHFTHSVYTFIFYYANGNHNAYSRAPHQAPNIRQTAV